ncbi:FtsX-like permease family protein [Solihabitans fulvus]|uniref:FtsX-like permease family protein n=1 Tax=Solihabitans fulvus TaxID=1892852 RepID=A0A5B2WWL6_9PSEU|nr:FtsX-like permease family protein [Solihabitans fulvus]KAA2255905.1 FtsX-like permease family protein [Solihabitans fulvus]
MRLALTAVGVGLGVMVLLAATSVPHMLAGRADRGNARAVHFADEPSSPVPGVDAALVTQRNDEFLGRGLQGYLVELTGPAAPHAPGVSRLPGPGEAVLSPALVDLLKSSDGELLRPRFSQRIVGTIGPEGLTGPNELFFYVGADGMRSLPGAARISSFGSGQQSSQISGLELLLIILGAATFLIPVVVFVATSTRLAASARDRRLAALRLVGADGKQVRRIAAGESFVGAIVGLVVGAVMFLIAKALVPLISVSALRGGIFSADIRPEWGLVGLIIVGVPLLSVGVAVLSLRRTIIEPLGVVRRAKSARRKLWWRLLPVVAGVGLLATQGSKFANSSSGASETPVIAGIVLLLIAVAVVLPWVVERVVWSLRGGSPAWQLAVRRLQLDSGTSARVVGGVAVVLTGAIALQALFLPAQADADARDSGPVEIRATMNGTSLAEMDKFAAALHGVPGFAGAKVSVAGTILDAEQKYASIEIGSCAELAAHAPLPGCVDGDVFYGKAKVTRGNGQGQDHGQGEPKNNHVLVPTAGQPVWFSGIKDVKASTPPHWTIPAVKGTVQLSEQRSDGGLLLVTPAALAGVRTISVFAASNVKLQTSDPRTVEYARNALFPLGWNANVMAFNLVADGGNSEYLLIKRVLNIGSVITLLLAAASLMVVALEQIRERRRALAVLVANGTQRVVLARSLLWQMAIPIVLAVAIAVGAGLGLAALLLAVVSDHPVLFDWPTIGIFSGAGLVAVLGVTVLTLPSLWRAASVEGLRGE